MQSRREAETEPSIGSSQDDLRTRLLGLILARVPADAILRDFQANNIPTNDVTPLIGEMRRRLFVASQRRGQIREHALWMSSVYRSLDRISGALEGAEFIAPDAFFRDFYACNRPLHFRSVIGSAHERCPAAPALRHYIDDIFVDVTRREERGDVGSVARVETLREITFARFVEESQAVLSPSHSDVECFTHDGIAHQVQSPSLFEAPVLPGILADTAMGALMRIAPQGASTPLRFENVNLVLLSIAGRTRVTLFSPSDEPFLPHEPDSNVSLVDVDSPDCARHPLFGLARPLVVDIEPGTGLFIPVAWWHRLESLTPTFTIAVSHFASRNNTFPACSF
jgi:hypothetical protein